MCRPMGHVYLNEDNAYLDHYSMRTKCEVVVAAHSYLAMRYLAEKKNKRKLPSWNKTNRIVCIICRI